MIKDKESTTPVKKYNCNASTYQCVESTTGTYSSLTECQNSCKAPTSKPTITDTQRKCTSDSQCQIIETDCCGCSYGEGYDFKTKQAILKTSYSLFYSQLNTFCTANKLKPCSAKGSNTCYLTPTAKCVSNLCIAQWPTPKSPTVTSTMKKCTKDTDCVLAESDCCGCEKGGSNTTKVGLNKYYLTNYNTQVLTYCRQSQAKCSSSTDNCGTINVACENSLCVAKPLSTSSNDSATL
jgi:hypothetical protein